MFGCRNRIEFHWIFLKCNRTSFTFYNTFYCWISFQHWKYLIYFYLFFYMGYFNWNIKTYKWWDEECDFMCSPDRSNFSPDRIKAWCLNVRRVLLLPASAKTRVRRICLSTKFIENCKLAGADIFRRQIGSLLMHNIVSDWYLCYVKLWFERLKSH